MVQGKTIVWALIGSPVIVLVLISLLSALLGN